MTTIAPDPETRIRDRFLRGEDATAHIPYCREMMIEVAAEWEIVRPGEGWIEAALAAWRTDGRHLDGGGPWIVDGEPRERFASAGDALARATSDQALAERFVADTARMLEAVPRDDEGLMVYVIPPTGSWLSWLSGRAPLQVDAMQEYASRLASAAHLGGDPAWFDVAVHQITGYARILPDPGSGLWHLGRDWGVRPATLCPGAWSRGHGWLLRGIVETLRWLPVDHERRPAVRAVLLAVLEALAPRQDDEGMWHVLLHRSRADSEPETSGTAFIASAIARAIAGGDLDGERWLPIARRALEAVRRRVDEQGVVSGACGAPGLLFDDGEAAYLRRPIAPDDPHGPPTVLYALLGEELLRDA